MTLGEEDLMLMEESRPESHSARIKHTHTAHYAKVILSVHDPWKQKQHSCKLDPEAQARQWYMDDENLCWNGKQDWQFNRVCLRKGAQATNATHACQSRHRRSC